MFASAAFVKYLVSLKLTNKHLIHSYCRYIQIPAAEVDTELLQDAARKENSQR